MFEAPPQLLNLIDNLDEAPKFHTRDFTPPAGYTHCACGKKFIPIASLRIHSTDFIKGVTDCLCRECEPQYRRMAYIVCIRCKSVVSRIQPMSFKSGFQLRPGAFYHTNACPECVKNLSTSVILEQHFYEKERGVATPKLIT